MTRIPDRPSSKPSTRPGGILADWRPDGWDAVLKAVEGGMGYEAACRSVGVSSREMRYWKNPQPGGRPPRIPEMEAELQAARKKAKQRDFAQKPKWWDTVIDRRKRGATVAQAASAAGVTQAEIYDLISPRGSSGKIRRPDLRQEWLAAGEQAQQPAQQQPAEPAAGEQVKNRLEQIKAQIRLGYSPQAAAKSLGLDDFDAFLQAHPDVSKELAALAAAPLLPPYRVWVQYLLTQMDKEIKISEEIAEETGDESELFDLRLLRDVVATLDVAEIEVRLPVLRNRLLKIIGRRYEHRSDMPEDLREG